MSPNRLERYLDQLEVPLAQLPGAERAAWREEARQHVLCLVAAHEELGAEPDAALEMALQQFGDAERLAHDYGAAARRALGWRAQPLCRSLIALAMCTSALGSYVFADGHIEHFLWFSIAIAAAHLPGALFLAQRVPIRLPGWALLLPFAPYLAFCSLYTVEAIRDHLRHGFFAPLLLCGAALNWFGLALCLLIVFLGPRRRDPAARATHLT
jgi:hypothetical protein